MRAKSTNLNCIKESAKLPLRNVTQTFNTEKNKNDTKLPSEYWKLANKNFHPRIPWSFAHAGNWELLKSIVGTKFRRSRVCLHSQAGIRL